MIPFTTSVPTSRLPATAVAVIAACVVVPRRFLAARWMDVHLWLVPAFASTRGMDGTRALRPAARDRRPGRRHAAGVNPSSQTPMLQNLLSGAIDSLTPTASDVAWWAHIGGYVAGSLLVRALCRRDRHGHRPGHYNDRRYRVRRERY